MTENSFVDSSAPEAIAEEEIRDEAPRWASVDQWWFEKRYVYDRATVIQKLGELPPYDRLGRKALGRIASVLAKTPARDLWRDQEAEWFKAMTDVLWRCDARNIANTFWALQLLRTSKHVRDTTFFAPSERKDCDIPENFKTNLWLVLGDKIHTFNAYDLAQTLTGMVHEGLEPPPELWDKICTRCTEVMSDPEMLVHREDIRDLVWSFSEGRREMPETLKEALFGRAGTIKLRDRDYIDMAIDFARTGDVYPPAFAAAFYKAMQRDWDRLIPFEKAQVLYATATFSVIAPLPSEAIEFLSSVSVNDNWNDPKNIPQVPLARILYRLFPKYETALPWTKTEALWSVGPDLCNRLLTKDVSMSPLRDVVCVANTSEGPVILQRGYEKQYIRDGAGRIVRSNGETMLNMALVADAFSTAPSVHIADQDLPKISDGQLLKFLTKAAAKRSGAYRLYLTPGSVCRLEKVPVAELPKEASTPHRADLRTQRNRSYTPA